MLRDEPLSSSSLWTQRGWRYGREGVPHHVASQDPYLSPPRSSAKADIQRMGIWYGSVITRILAYILQGQEKSISVRSCSTRLFLPKIKNIRVCFSSFLDLCSATREALDHLASSCEPATFGLANKDVFDESYRKAGKMDTERFASKFNLETSRILPTVIPQLLVGLRKNADRVVEAELYKLNVYGTLECLTIPVSSGG